MPIDKAQRVFCVGIVSVNYRMPRAAKECGPLANQYRLGRTFDGTQLLACYARNGPWPHLVSVEGVTREGVPNLL